MGPRMNENELVFLPLGGVGEIGMNVYLYGLGPPRRRQWLMVDLGVTFPDDREPGVDIVLPDLRFITEERSNLAGILLTWLVFFLAERVDRFLGQTGRSILTRLLGVILAALAVQFVADGIRELMAV